MSKSLLTQLQDVEGVGGGHKLTGDITEVIEHLERHCLALDGSFSPKSTYIDLQLAKEEMSRERLPYLERMAFYCEAGAMVEEYLQSVTVPNLGGARDIPGHGLRNPSQVYETLEHRLVVAEACQRLRLPLISKDSENHEGEIEKWSTSSRNSFDSSCTISTNYSSNSATSNTDVEATPIGGVPDRFLGITPQYLWQTQLQKQTLPSMSMADYQMSICREIDIRLKDKCDKVADFCDSSFDIKCLRSRLPERLKLIIEEIESKEAALQESLYSAIRKFADHYNVLEQILALLIKLVKDLKLQHQFKHDELRKTWLCKRCDILCAKLSAIEHDTLYQTYTKESIPALRKIRKILEKGIEEASDSYEKALSRVREYQGVDPNFDLIAMQYREIVKNLKDLQWTIQQVEMDLNG